MRRFLLWLGISLAASAGAGCAGTDEQLRKELTAERNEELSIVSRQDLYKSPPDSPQRAILALWRAIQFRDAAAALAQLTPRPTEAQSARAESFFAGEGASTTARAKPRFVQVTRNGANAAAVIEIVSRKKVGSRVASSVSDPLRFDLELGRFGWKVRWLEFIRRLTSGRIDLEPAARVAGPGAATGSLDGREAPKRAALSWWNALREQHPATVIGLLSPAARGSINNRAIAHAVTGKLGDWARGTRASVLYSERWDSRVTVFMEVEGGDRIGRMLAKRGALMLALPLVPQQGRWLVDDTAWLRERVETYEPARQVGHASD